MTPMPSPEVTMTEALPSWRMCAGQVGITDSGIALFE